VPARTAWAHDAIGDAPDRPLCGTRPADVDDWECRVDLSGLLGNFPAINLAPQADFGHERAVCVLQSPEQGHRLFARCRYGGLKPAFAKRVFKHYLDCVVILNRKNDRKVLAQRFIPLRRRANIIDHLLQFFFRDAKLLIPIFGLVVLAHVYLAAVSRALFLQIIQCRSSWQARPQPRRKGG
jgi:hypothetical protein